MCRTILFLALLQPLLAQDQPVPAPPVSAAAEPEGFHWGPALKQSALYLVVQHSSRMFQAKTRRELGGPFLPDYFTSASSIHTWSDQDGILTNYVGHPMMGAVAGYLQVFNDPGARKLEFNLSSKAYWRSRLKGLAWSAAYSTQYELGPLSEASIGNVGKVPPAMAVTDLVMTPLGGFGLMLLEDWLDKRFVSRWERGSRTRAKFFRMLLNPNRSLANLLRGKRPSYRDNRPL